MSEGSGEEWYNLDSCEMEDLESNFEEKKLKGFSTLDKLRTLLRVQEEMNGGKNHPRDGMRREVLYDNHPD